MVDELYWVLKIHLMRFISSLRIFKVLISMGVTWEFFMGGDFI